MTTLEPLLRELLGGALRSRRRAHGRTLADVAAQAGVSMQHLSDVERGRKDASSEMLAAICGALGTSVLELMASAARPEEGISSRTLDLTRRPRPLSSAPSARAASARGAVSLSAA